MRLPTSRLPVNVLAVDGGGTKTALAVVDQQGQVLYRAAGGGINPFDQSDWQEDLQAMLNSVTEPYGAAALALPGYGEAAAITAQQHQVAADLGVPHQVLNDVDAAHLGAFAGGPGLLILAGTGSMVWGRDSAGTTLRVGGWGDLLGDEGSAYWTGLRALNSLTRVLDGRRARTGLHDCLLAALQQTGTVSPDNVLPSDSVLSWLVALKHPRSQIAALAQHLDTWAEAGDRDATQLLEEAAAELALLARTAQARLPGLGAAWSVAGSFTRSQTVQRVLRRELGADAFHPATLPPLGGAALAAARVAGWPITPEWTARLSADLQ